MKKNLFIGFLLVFLSFSSLSFGQISISFQYSENSKIGVGYNFTRRLWTELRMNKNKKFFDVNSDLALLFNLIKKDEYDLYLGVSGQIWSKDNFQYSIPMGLQIRPIDAIRRLSFLVEFRPAIIPSTDEFERQYSVGIRFMFGDVY